MGPSLRLTGADPPARDDDAVEVPFATGILRCSMNRLDPALEGNAGGGEGKTERANLRIPAQF